MFRFETANERWKWFKKSDYEGWTNWDTWNTALMISNNWPHENSNQEAYQIVGNGGTVQELADWALQKIIGPHNQKVIEDAQQWTEEEEVAAMKEHDLEKWMQKAEELYPDSPEARTDFVEKMRGLVYGIVGEPQPTDVSQHLIEEGKINWQEIYDSIVYVIEENRRYEAS